MDILFNQTQKKTHNINNALENIRDAYRNDHLRKTKYNNNTYITRELTTTIVHDHIWNTHNQSTSTLDHADISNLFAQIVPKELMIRDFFIYDLINYTPPTPTIHTKEDLVALVGHTLAKYQYIAGGYNIEDCTWLHTASNHRFKLKDNHTLLYNTIERRLCDNELITFLDRIIAYAKRHIANTKLNIKYSIINDERNSICWISIIFRDGE